MRPSDALIPPVTVFCLSRKLFYSLCPSHRSTIIAGECDCFFFSFLRKRLKSVSIRRPVDMAALRCQVNERGGFPLGRGQNRGEQGVFVWRADLQHSS